jgi:MGT family glycosyltransferase
MFDPQPRKSFLIATWEGGGSVGPALTVARKLIDAGHDVRVMSDACNRPESEATGARFLTWTRAPNRTDRRRESELVRDWAGSTITEGLSQVLLALTAGRAKDYAEDLIEELARDPADLVIGSELILGVELGCEVLKRPCVVLACNSLMFPVDGAPQAGPPMTAAQQDALRPVLDQLSAAFAIALPSLNEARAHFGLTPLDNLWNQVLAAKKTLIAVSRTFDFGPEADVGHFAYVGPQLDEVGWTETGHGFEAPQDSRPLVLVSFSTTFQNHGGILQKVVDALGRLPVAALVTLGPTILPEEINAAANVRLVRSAPHNQLMKQASLIVTHGGHGTVARGLIHHLPMLVIPHGRDQDGNAARVVAHGAGRMLPPTAETDEIREAIAMLLRDQAFREGAARLGEAIRQDMRDCDVVAELEALCEAVPA